MDDKLIDRLSRFLTLYLNSDTAIISNVEIPDILTTDYRSPTFELSLDHSSGLCLAMTKSLFTGMTEILADSNAIHRIYGEASGLERRVGADVLGAMSRMLLENGVPPSLRDIKFGFSNLQGYVRVLSYTPALRLHKGTEGTEATKTKYSSKSCYLAELQRNEEELQVFLSHLSATQLSVQLSSNLNKLSSEVLKVLVCRETSAVASIIVAHLTKSHRRELWKQMPIKIAKRVKKSLLAMPGRNPGTNLIYFLVLETTPILQTSGVELDLIASV